MGGALRKVGPELQHQSPRPSSSLSGHGEGILSSMYRILTKITFHYTTATSQKVKRIEENENKRISGLCFS
jgi:hypothetical protein